MPEPKTKRRPAKKAPAKRKATAKKKAPAKKAPAKKAAAKKAPKRVAKKRPAKGKAAVKKKAPKRAAKKRPARGRRRGAQAAAVKAVRVELLPAGDIRRAGVSEGVGRLELAFRAREAVTARGAKLEGHQNFVQALAFSPDGAVLVTGSEDGTMRVWDAQTRECRATLTEHTSAVNCVAFTPDGAHLLSASDDSTVRLWRASDFEPLRVFEGHSGYVSEVHPAGPGRAVSSGDDGTLRLWDLATGECVRVMHHGSWVNAMDASPDGRFAVASSTDNVLRAWNLATGEVERTLVDASSLNAGTVMGLIVAGENRSGVGHGSFARHVAWAPDGRRFYTSGKEIIEWDVETWAEVGRVDGDGWDVTGFALVPNSRRVLAAAHGTLTVYDLDERKALAGASWNFGGDCHAAAVSPDGARGACGSHEGPVGLWDLAALLRGGLSDRHLDHPFSAAVSPDGAYAITGGSDRTARVWDTATGATKVYRFDDGLFVQPVLFTRDGRFVVAMNDKATLALLDPASGRCLGTARFADPQNYRPFLKVHELRDGRLLVGSVGGPLTLWTLDPLAATPDAFAGDAGHVTAMALDPGERVAVTGSYGDDKGPVTVAAWNVASRTKRWETAVRAPGYAASVAVVGARVVVTTSKGALLVLDLDTGAPGGGLQVLDDYLMHVVPLDARRVAVGASDPVVVDLDAMRAERRLVLGEKRYLVPIPGEPRALLTDEEGVAEVDLAASTLTLSLKVGSVNHTDVNENGRFVAVTPRAELLLGTPLTLRREPGDRVEIASPELPERTMKGRGR